MDKDTDLRRAREVYLLLAGVIGLWLLWDAVTVQVATSFVRLALWEHAAALTEWMRELNSPDHPVLNVYAPSYSYTPMYYLLALLGRQFGLDAMFLLGIAAVVNYTVLALAIYLFCRTYFRHPWAPVIGLLVLLCGWGVPWVWSGLYELRSLFYVAAYPSMLAFALSLLAFWCTLGFIRGHIGLVLGMILMFALSVLIVMTHAPMAIFGLGGSILIALLDRNCPLSLRCLIVIAAAAGAAMADLWPYYPVWEPLRVEAAGDGISWLQWPDAAAMEARANSNDWRHLFLIPTHFVTGLGPALLGVPLCLWLALRRTRVFIPTGALLMVVPVVVNTWVEVAQIGRFVIYTVFFLQLALIHGLLTVLDEWRYARRAGGGAGFFGLLAAPAAAVLGLAVAGHVALLAVDQRGQHLRVDMQLVATRATMPESLSVGELYRRLAAELPDKAVVAGEPWLTWPLPAFAGKAMAMPSTFASPAIDRLEQRQADAATLLAAASSAAERETAARRYGVSHVLVYAARTPPELQLWLDANGRLLTAVGPYRLVELQLPRLGR